MRDQRKSGPWQPTAEGFTAPLVKQTKPEPAPVGSRLVVSSLSLVHLRPSGGPNPPHLTLLNHSLAPWLPSSPVLSFLWTHRTFHLLLLILDRACTRDQVFQVTRASLAAESHHSTLPSFVVISTIIIFTFCSESGLLDFLALKPGWEGAQSFLSGSSAYFFLLLLFFRFTAKWRKLCRWVPFGSLKEEVLVHAPEFDVAVLCRLRGARCNLSEWPCCGLDHVASVTP
jgi:hypothetical protein